MYPRWKCMPSASEHVALAFPLLQGVCAREPACNGQGGNGGDAGRVANRRVLPGRRPGGYPWRSEGDFMTEISGDKEVKDASVRGCLDLARAITLYSGDTGEEIRKQFEFVESFLNAICTPVFYKDATGRFLGCNSAYEKFFGVKSSRLHGKCLDDTAPRSDRIGTDADPLCKHPGAHSYDADIRHIDGSTRNVIVHKTTIADRNNIVRGVVGVLIDVTGGKTVERQLLKSKHALELRVAARTRDIAAVNLQLQALNDQLFQVMSAREGLEAELEKSCVRLRELVAELNIAEEKERRRIAVNLHDNVVQNLALGQMKLAVMCPDDLAPEFARTLKQVFDGSIRQIRDLCFELSSPVLYELGLPQAIESLGQRLSETHGFSFTFRRDMEEDKLPEDLCILLYQTVRELMVNAIKHGLAKKIDVQMRQRLGVVRMTVLNDGMPYLGGKKGFGLSNVSQRINHLKGHLEISRTKLGKTVVEVFLPVPQ